jgi:hypothetical protein
MALLTELSKILPRYHNALQVNIFNKVEEISSKVCIVSLTPLAVTPLDMAQDVDQANQLNIECRYDFSTDEFDVGTIVNITGILVMESNNLVLRVRTMCTEAEIPIDATQDEMWHKLRYHVATKPERSFIAELSQVTPPLFVKNVGLVVPPKNKRGLKAFNDKMIAMGVKANIFIYNMESSVKIETALRNGLLYFQKYHNIDVICLLLDNLDPQTAIALSTAPVYNIFRQRKQTVQYVVSIINSTAEYTPIIAKLVNLECKSHDAFANFLLQSRKNFEAVIKTASEKVLTVLQQNLADVDSEIELSKQNLEVSTKLFGAQIFNEKQLFEEVRSKIFMKLTEFDVNFSRTSFRICQAFSKIHTTEATTVVPVATPYLPAPIVTVPPVPLPTPVSSPAPVQDLMKTIFPLPPAVPVPVIVPEEKNC